LDKSATPEIRRFRIAECLIRLRAIASAIQQSDFFKHHEVIGSSLLFLYDNDKVGIWLIDFAKALPVTHRQLDHVSQWQFGNHEDGYLTGILNMIKMFERLQ